MHGERCPCSKCPKQGEQNQDGDKETKELPRKIQRNLIISKTDRKEVMEQVGGSHNDTEMLGDRKKWNAERALKRHNEIERSESLLKSYHHKTIHGPATLDEWYYHFSAGKKSTEDKLYRNKSQVVTKELGVDTNEESQWRLLRVNQLWAWVIGDKWLITATWDPIDGIEEAFPDGILNHIRKQSQYKGGHFQPKKSFHMSRLLVDYCIRLYETATTNAEGSTSLESQTSIRQLSIRQMFSNQINGIGRDETNLFNKFSSQKNKGQTLQDLLLDNEIRQATVETKKLSCGIKDIRDELNIIKSLAQYQKVVQSGMDYIRHATPVCLGADYVLEDIRQLDMAADRIESAINVTLSLQQSEIANIQATLSAEQGRESVSQGQTLMVFTLVTILFLPLSFLSSFFAMDTGSFHASDTWAKGFVFGASFFLFFIVYILMQSNKLAFLIKPRDRKKPQAEVVASLDTNSEARRAEAAVEEGANSEELSDSVTNSETTTPAELESAARNRRERWTVRFRGSKRGCTP